METAMQIEKELRLAEDLIPSLVFGEKLVTIRKGKRMFGSTVRIAGHLAAVDLVQHSTINSCSLKILKNDGFKSRKDAVEKMKRFYPDITGDTDITIVEFHLISEEPQRYFVGSDNSGHEYFIKVEERDEFYKWAEDEDTDDPGKYDEFRIDGHFTFTDPRNE